MARFYQFLVGMAIPDDDQTDPDEMAAIIHSVLDCKPGAGADWKEGHDDMKPRARPVWTVKWLSQGGWEFTNGR